MSPPMVQSTLATVHEEARRLLDKGFKLCKLKHLEKRPEGDGWQLRPIQSVDDNATGYGVMLAANNLCSIDPDNVEPAREGLRRCGFDLDDLMAAGVRTTSTRPRSGGRSTFKAPADLLRVRFASKRHGTILELRAGNSNLQDCLPGTTYLGKQGDGPYRQDYANGKTLDTAPELPADFLAWWHRLNNNLEYKREQQALFCGEDEAMLDVSGGGGSGAKLAFPSSHRIGFNRLHSVPDIILRHGYTTGDGERWAPASATGAPCVRLIPGHDDLWQSDHASDPLCGTFDPWTAFVVLDHGGDLSAAEGAWALEERNYVCEDFGDLEELKRQKLADAIERIEMHDLIGGDLVAEVETILVEISCEESEAAQVISKAQEVAGKVVAEKLRDAISIEKLLFVEYAPDLTRLRPVEFVVDGFIANGLTVIAGAPGEGKTMMVTPLAAAVAGLFESDLQAVLRRKVVYISEAPEQVERILYGLTRHAPGARPVGEFYDWFKLIPSRRLPPEKLAGLIRTMVKQHTVEFNSYPVAPLIVLDTSNANIDLENENDNAEAGRAIAAIKENLGSGACWLIAHTPKTLQRADVDELSARGAGAFEGDANATAFVFREKNIPDKRFMRLKKHRFEAEFMELDFTTQIYQQAVPTPWGAEQIITYRIGLPTPTHAEKRLAARESAKARMDEEHLTSRMREIKGLITDYLVLTGKGEGQSKNAIERAVRRKAQDVRTCISHMVEDGALVVVGVGKGGGALYDLPPEPALIDPDLEEKV